MIGTFYINGVDVFLEYGIFILEGGYNDIIAWPELKEPESNDWHEFNGYEVDLLSPTLDVYEFNLPLGLIGGDIVLSDFFLFINSQVYHEFDFRAIGRKFIFRVVENSDYNFLQTLNKITLKLADDYPTQRLNSLDIDLVNSISVEGQFGLNSSLITNNWTGTFNPGNIENTLSLTATGYVLNEIDLCNYGISILDGTLSTFKKKRTLKENLGVSILKNYGQFYDTNLGGLKQQEVTLKCLMRSDTLDNLWRQYDSLLFVLLQAGDKEIFVEQIGSSFVGYYHKSSVKVYSDKWLEFEITLLVNEQVDQFTIVCPTLSTEEGDDVTTEGGIDVSAFACYREMQLYLSTEDKSFVTTQEGDYYIINYTE